MKALVTVTTICLMIIIATFGGYTIARASQMVYINPGSLDDHGCDDTEWHFIVTQVSNPSLAPASIHVVWENGAEADVPLDGVTGQAAHYYDYSNLNSPVANAWMSIYDEWSGTFNLSHGPCFEDPTPTPTTEVPSATPTAISTSTPTAAPTNTSTPTSTETEVPTVTYTPTSTSTGTQPTPTATSTSTETATVTPTYSPTPTTDPRTPTGTPTETPMPTSTPFITLTPDPTETPRPPQPADGNEDAGGYPGAEMGALIMGGDIYPLYLGVNAKDGSLLLPSFNKGAALYQKTIWVHRLWNTGWLDLDIGDTVYFENVAGIGKTYAITGKTFIDYGEYPKTETYGEVFQYIATCYSNNQGQWVGVELFRLQLDD